MNSWKLLKQQILEKIQPTKTEKERIKKFTNNLLEEINQQLKKQEIPATAELHGSIAHDTWIANEQDLDIFIVLEQNNDVSNFQVILSMLKNYLGKNWREAYAEHPYLQSQLNDYNIDFVPCYRISKGQKIISSTDRTPLHTTYLKDKLTKAHRNEVRLLKQFTKRIGVYGAEIKIEGFSGYLCELLVLHYGSLKKVLEAFSHSSDTMEIKRGSIKKDTEKKQPPIILADPVDPKRNVASAVNKTSYWTFVLASRNFLNKPELKYFFKPKTRIEKQQIISKLRLKESDYLFILIEENKPDVPDSLWGQLHKTHQALYRFLSKNDFNILKSKTWSNEKTRHIFVFELESVIISNLVRRNGPPVKLWKDVEKFIEAHINADDTVSGPGIHNDKLWVIKRRTYNDAITLLTKALKNGGQRIGVAKNLSTRIKKHHQIILNTEIERYLDKEFNEELYKMILGRPDWLD
jgi:tRNA nucleotidyltransferase (CCA-adding enzyme)